MRLINSLFIIIFHKDNILASVQYPLILLHLNISDYLFKKENYINE